MSDLMVTSAGTATPNSIALDMAGPGTKQAVPRVTASLILDRYLIGSRATRPAARQYWINRAFMVGQQWIWWNKIRNRIDELPKDERVRATINTIWGYSRTIISKLVQRELDWDVAPNEGDDASIQGALLAEAILRHTSLRRNWEQLRLDQAWQTWMGGTCGISVDWDTSAGQPLSMGGDSLAFEPLSGRNVGTGEIVETVMSIAEMCTEPGARNAETSRWWIRSVALAPEDVRVMYDMDITPDADATAYLSPYQSRIATVERGDMPLPLTLVLSYYERPNPLRPEGAVAVVVNGKIVSGPDKWPFPFKDRLNLVIFRETPQSDRWWADTILSAAIPVQTAYNASWSSIIEHMKLAGNARLLVPDGAVDMIDEINDSPDSVIPFNKADGLPEYLSPPQMPAWWVQQPEMLDAVMQTIMGVHDVEKGEAPPNIESGVGLAILGESSETPLALMTKDMAGGWSRYATLVLRLYEAKVKESRTVRMSRGSASAAPSLTKWTGKALAGQTEAKVPLEAIVPRSRAAMQAWATALWDRHIISDPKMYAKVANLPTRDNFAEGLDPDLGKAQRENHDMAIGEVCIPASFDNHQTHITSHNNFRKSERYERLKVASKATVDQHVKAHENLAAEAVAMQSLKMNVSPNLAAAPNANETPPLAHPLAPPAAVPSAPTAGERALAAQVHGPHPADQEAAKQAAMQEVLAQMAAAQQPGPPLPANLTAPTANPFGITRLPQGADDFTDTAKQETGYGPTP